MTANMNKLAVLTSQLPELDELETPAGGPVVMFSNNAGSTPMNAGLGIGLHRSKDLAVMRAFMPKGTKIEGHQHIHEHEWVGVITGALRIHFLDSHDFIDVPALSVIHIAPGRPHIAEALEDCWCWGVTVPPAAGYPDVSICPFAAKAELI